MERDNMNKEVDVIIGGRYQHKATGLIMKLEMGSWTDNEVRLVESETFAKQGFKNTWTGSIDELGELWMYRGKYVSNMCVEG
jgi:hypothetical protein